MERIGFIGLGAMGGPMASNLCRKGFDVLVYDVVPESAASLEALGATVSDSVAAVAAEADIVVTMLPDSGDVETVVLGAGGIAEAGRRDLLVMDMSTIAPAMTDRLAAALTDKGMDFVDAPVGRLASHAARGESLFMVGAGDNAIGRVRPLLEAMGTTIHHCGGPGAGIRTKLINNYIAIVVCQANAEAMALAASMGLDTAMTLDVINGTTATNGHLKSAWPAKVLSGDTDPGFRITLALKDLGLGLDAAAQMGVPAFVGAAARECLGQACRTDDFAGRDFSALLDYVCGQAGIAPPRLTSSDNS